MYSFKDYLNKNLIEISSDDRNILNSRIDNIKDEENRSQGLDNLFKNKQRLVISFGSPEIKSIIDQLTDFYEERKDSVTLSFNWEDKELSIISKNPNAGKEITNKDTGEKMTIPDLSTQKISIAKAMKQAHLDPKLIDWFSVFANDEMVSRRERRMVALASKNDYSIIISRHPVDILRMSDFPKIQSCHSPDGNKYSCAKQEAIDGGAIAYLVYTQDLKNIDLEDDEIFEDPDRNVYGIDKPLSRLRIRRFTSKFNDVETDQPFDIGIPEDSTYGMRHPSFIDQVSDWLRKEQSDIIKRNGGREKFRIKNFVLRGGNYRDSEDGALFNSYFQDRLDRGNTGWEFEGSEHMIDQLEQLRTEIEEIHELWNGKFKHCYTGWSELDYYDDNNNEFNYSCEGFVPIVIDMDLYSQPDEKDITGSWNDKGNSLLKFLSNYNIDSFDRDKTHINNNSEGHLEIQLGVDGDSDEDYRNRTDLGRDPNAYDEFCDYMYREYDQKYDDIKKLVEIWFKINYASNEPAAVGLLEKFKNNEIQFANFEFSENLDKDIDEAEVLFYLTATAKIKVTDPIMAGSQNNRISGPEEKTNFSYSYDMIGKMVNKMFKGVMDATYKGEKQQLKLPFTSNDMSNKQMQLPFKTDTSNSPLNFYDPKIGVNDKSENKYRLHQNALPQIFISAMPHFYITATVTFYFNITDDKKLVQQALLNAKVYDRNWQSLIENAELAINRAQDVRRFGRNNYYNYDQNKQAYLLGKKFTPDSPNQLMQGKANEKEKITYRDQLPYNPYPGR